MTGNQLLYAIEQRREDLGMNTISLANKAGISPALYRHWMDGDNSPTVDRLISVAQALGMHLRIETNGKVDVSPCMGCSDKRTCMIRCNARWEYEKRREEARA